jgi:hypothetical protein
VTELELDQLRLVALRIFIEFEETVKRTRAPTTMQRLLEVSQKAWPDQCVPSVEALYEILIRGMAAVGGQASQDQPK